MSEQPAPVGSEVHVLTWVHTRGEDMTAHATWDGAVAAKALIARRGWADLREVCPEAGLPEVPPDDDREVAEMYFAHSTDESAHIESLTVEA